MQQEKIKYKLTMVLERDGIQLTINDEVESPFSLDDYIYNHDYEAYNIIDFKLVKVKN